tara:strand:- start:305 stop:901 length:597 start_codon:yes stop_codon:yes gene_type:complete
MARGISNVFNTQLSSQQLRPFYAVKMNFTSGTLLISTINADIDIGGNTYIGAGTLLTVSNVLESADTKATGIKITLNSIETSILSAGLTEDTSGMVCEVYFGLLTTTNNADALVDTPYQIFSGFIDSMVLEENQDNSTLTFTVESKMVSLERPIDRRYTAQDQEELFTGDKGCNFVTSLQDKSVGWGAGVELPQPKSS